MRTIIVDDDQWMLKAFRVECEGVPDIQITGEFTDPEDALGFAEKNTVELAFLDIEMPKMDGMVLAKKLKAVYPEIIIIFISGRTEYMPEAFSNVDVQADYFITKPFRKENIQKAFSQAKLLSKRQKKRIVIHTFGNFNVYLDGKPICFDSKKAKEILAVLVDARGDTVTNGMLYETVWERECYDHQQMKSYHNAMARLKIILKEAGIPELMQSMPREHSIVTDLCDCDYFDLLRGDPEAIREWNGIYMSEYSWSEERISELLNTYPI